MAVRVSRSVRAVGAPGGLWTFLDPVSAAAYPADSPRGVADHKSVVFHVPRDHSTRPDCRIRTDGHATHDGCVCPDRCACSDESWGDLPIGRGGTRPQIVREDGARANKDRVLQGHPVVDGDVVLDLAAVADLRLGIDEDVLSDGATGADFCSTSNMRLVPDIRALTNGCTVFDGGGGMDRHATHSSGSLI